MSSDFDPYSPIFTQAEACEIARVDPSWVNNWIARGHVEIAPATDRRLGGRRLFSPQDIVFLAAMGTATNDIGMQPADAKGFAHRAAVEVWYSKREGFATLLIGKRVAERSRPDQPVRFFWQVGFVWFEKSTGVISGPGGATVDLANETFVLMPCSELVDGVMQRCRAMLSKENDEAGQ